MCGWDSLDGQLKDGVRLEESVRAQNHRLVGYLAIEQTDFIFISF